MMTDFGRQEYARLTEKRALFIAALILILAALVGVAVTLGSANLPVADSYLAILAGLFPEAVDLPDRMVESNAVGIVWGWRLHRVLFAIVAGFGLAIAGTVMQGVLRNPLASPFTLGIASAASCGASVAIILGAGFLSGYLVIGNAFLFAMLAAGAIYGMARLKGMGSETMILAGIALMYLFSAVTSFLQYLGTSEKVQEVVFWMFGSLDKSSWPKLGLVTVVVVAVVPLLLWRAWDLNALAEGDETAKSLGVPVERSMAGFMLAASLVTAVIICFTGTIGFIGLVAPHITRMVIGADHRTLIPASGLVGAVILLGADCLARTVIPGAIIPVGIMTAFLGIPFFVYLFMRRRDA
ncbi:MULTISPECIES: iron ABC transporter permease [unclassified Methanoculleus]|jgi:iron complex transport system permease protein|uniref:FecCD family ABC transporter permease n=3 Tax=Methanoculleus TaxID=45989 RepID=UPI00316AD909